jgi:pimeloyl-ACP methyl ester carboxylesterase
MFDPPGLDPGAGRRWLRIPDHAAWLADAVRREGSGPVVVVGHSLGGLVALRLALDEPQLVAALLLLDPGPPVYASLAPPRILRAVGLARRFVPHHARRREPRDVPVSTRARWFVVGGAGIAADLSARRFPDIATVLVTAGEHAPDSLLRRTHEKVAALIPGAAHEVWPGTTHGIHPEEPARVAETALRLAGYARPRADLPRL